MPKPISWNCFEAVLLGCLHLRSAIVPPKQAGAICRDTVDPLDELKRGSV